MTKTQAHSLVSILTPTFNHEAFIAECIESVLAQDYTNFELIILDDGSNDRTMEIARGYADPRIKCHTLPHRGLGALAATYNYGLRIATGDIIAILDGDDAWPADKLSRQLPYFRDRNLLLSWGDAEFMDRDSRAIAGPRSPRTVAPRWADARSLFPHLALENFISPACTIMVRRGAVEAIGGFTQKGSTLTADYATWLRVIATQDGTCCFIPEPLGRYRLYPEQTSQRYRGRMAEEYAAVVQLFKAELDRQAAEALGWDDELSRRINIEGKIQKGRAHLEAGDFALARAAYTGALAKARTPRERFRSLVGYASAIIRFDMHVLASRLVRLFPRVRGWRSLRRWAT